MRSLSRGICGRGAICRAADCRCGYRTAGFIGVVPDSLIIPQRRITGETKRGEVVRQPPLTWQHIRCWTRRSFVFRVGGAPVGATLAND